MATRSRFLNPLFGITSRRWTFKGMFPTCRLIDKNRYWAQRQEPKFAGDGLRSNPAVPCLATVSPTIIESAAPAEDQFGQATLVVSQSL